MKSTKRRGRRLVALAAAVLLCALSAAAEVRGQSVGVELQNMVMPASGGMGGVSIADPQDMLSALNGNPATLSGFRGTRFSFGGVWADPSIDLSHTGNGDVPGINRFSQISGTPGTLAGNIGVSQDTTALGLPATLGLGLITTAGLGVDYAAAANSNYSSLTLQVLHMQPGLGVRLTDRLSAGANFGLGIALFDGLFVGQSKATPAYGARGSLGLNFAVDSCTRIGGYYQTKERFLFEDAIILQPFAAPAGLPLDVTMDLPPNLGLGIAHSGLAGGRLLLAADVVCKFWEEASLFSAIYRNQLVVQLGAQYSLPRAKLRAGYVWAENSMLDIPGSTIGGIAPPGAINALQYIQGLAPNINEHRISLGAGIPDLLPGIDMDLFAGGVFEDSGSFDLTSVTVSSYFVGGGLTWRFGRGSGCGCQVAPDRWCQAAGGGPQSGR